jgi:predicted DNA-binding transcriptional regulator AlpA
MDAVQVTHTGLIDRRINIKEVCHIVGGGRAWVSKKVAAKEFPQPVRIGTRFTRYSLREVLEYARDPEAWTAANAK